MDSMAETTATTRARRRLKMITELRALPVLLVGAAVGLTVLSAVRLFSGQDEVFPTGLVSVLVIFGVVADLLTRRPYGEALDDLELAARNVGRSDALSPAGEAAPQSRL